MPKKRSRAARIFDNAVDSLESATATAGSKMKEGLDKAVDAVADSGPAQRIAAKPATARKLGVKKTSGVKKRASATAKKTSGVKKRASATAKKTSGAKKVAKKRASPTAKKTSGAKKAGGTRKA